MSAQSYDYNYEIFSLSVAWMLPEEMKLSICAFIQATELKNPFITMSIMFWLINFPDSSCEIFSWKYHFPPSGFFTSSFNRATSSTSFWFLVVDSESFCSKPSFSARRALLISSSWSSFYIFVFSAKPSSMFWLWSLIRSALLVCNSDLCVWMIDSFFSSSTFSSSCSF